MNYAVIEAQCCNNYCNNHPLAFDVTKQILPIIFNFFLLVLLSFLVHKTHLSQGLLQASTEYKEADKM